MGKELKASDLAVLDRTIKPRGRPLKYDIESVKEWEGFDLPQYLDGAALLSAVKSVVASGRRRGWNMVRTETHRLVRVGKGQRPHLIEDSF